MFNSTIDKCRDQVSPVFIANEAVRMIMTDSAELVEIFSDCDQAEKNFRYVRLDVNFTDFMWRSRKSIADYRWENYDPRFKPSDEIMEELSLEMVKKVATGEITPTDLFHLSNR